MPGSTFPRVPWSKLLAGWVDVSSASQLDELPYAKHDFTLESSQFKGFTQKSNPNIELLICSFSL
jgi:hypothetical protein